MSIKKLLGTGACMVIIGVSAGASYSLFQDLTGQMATSAVAQTEADVLEAPSTDVASAQFVAAGVTTWIPPEESDVSAPVLDKPAAFVQPEPPLLRYSPVQTNEAASETPATPLFAHIDDAVILGSTPETSDPDTSSAASATLPKVTSQPQDVAREVIVASAPRASATPGTLRRFRGTGVGLDQNGDLKESEPDRFEESAPTQQAVKPAQPRRPTVARTTRATQRTARFRQTWAVGVYR